MEASNPSVDFLLATKEYSGFITFVNETPPPEKYQLTHFLFPFYVYIYLLLFKNKKFTEAQRFVSTYSRLFLKAEGYGEIIQDLFKFKNLNEVQDHSYFKNFCEYRYKVKISKDSLRLLKKYLEDAECRILSPILHREFNIEVSEDQSNHENITTSSVEIKESTCQSTEDHLSTRNINVKKSKNELPSKIACYHYSIFCRKEQLCCVDINKRNTLFAAGFENSDIHVWNMDPDIVNKSVSKNLDISESKECLTSNLKDKTASTTRVCSGDTTARAWSMTDFKDVRAYCEHKYPIWDIDVSSNCAYFATASLDCTARLWSFNRPASLRIFVGHSSDVDCVRFHSNCRYLATASTDKTIQLWAIENGFSVRKFSGHGARINSITFSPDGKHLASADDSGCIKVWDLASGKLYSEICAHSKKILSISYNTNDSVIASCGIDSFVKIWDVKHSVPVDEKGKSEATLLVDSYSVDSVPHYVRFCQKDFLISVGTQTRTDN
ncbi:TAF5-like RNA polymerase II [Argiope bruennichi]|uniref:TAF5-like RNA polymerase II n=1 Tax=Argiope bruennichi TaxID=94029 RepID=A0A8T0EPT7_ARGBR|nr:TAF5-like RNA polymerase II [Argiope bruennichi]